MRRLNRGFGIENRPRGATLGFRSMTPQNPPTTKATRAPRSLGVFGDVFDPCPLGQTR